MLRSVRTGNVVVVLAILVAGCTAATVTVGESESARPAPTQVEASAGEPVDLPTSEPGDVPASESVELSPAPVTGDSRYTWRASVTLKLKPDEPPTTLTDVFVVQVDRARGTALVVVDTSVVPEALRPEGAAAMATVAYVEGTQLSRGFRARALGWRGEGGPNPQLWYLGRQQGRPGLPDILPIDASPAALAEALGATLDSEGAISLVDVADVGLEGNNLLAGLARIGFPTDGSLFVDLETDDHGRVTAMHVDSSASIHAAVFVSPEQTRALSQHLVSSFP